jgi:hypothetical protein
MFLINFEVVHQEYGDGHAEDQPCERVGERERERERGGPVVSMISWSTMTDSWITTTTTSSSSSRYLAYGIKMDRHGLLPVPRTLVMI